MRQEGTAKGYEVLARGLSDLGVKIVFGVTGADNVLMADAFVRDCGESFVPAAHEAGAVLMALGLASTSGDLGVATVTHGPGLTNAVTALVEGVRAGLPLLLIAVDTAVEEKFNWQAIEQRPVVLSTGAGFEQARSPRTLLRDLARAAQRAVAQRRPVVLNVPSTLFRAEVSYERVGTPYPVRQASPASREALEQAVAVLATARRPVVLAGRGAIDDRSRQALLKFAARIGAPVATTLKAKELFRGEPFDLGICGTLASDSTSEVVARTDCIVVFGASLNYRTTLGGDLLKEKRVVQCDADPAVIGASRPVDAGVVGDCGVVAEQLCGVLDEAGIPRTDFCTSELAGRLLPPTPPPFDDRSTSRTVDLRTLLDSLERAIPGDRVLVTDGGNFALEAWQRLSVDHSRRFVTTLGFGAIGNGMAYAIGASRGAPGRPVLAVMGDGGLTLGGLNEFGTAVRTGADVIAVVCNNGAYGTEYHHLLEAGREPSAAQFQWPDFAAVATSLGGLGVAVRCRADIERALQVIGDRDRPVLVDARTDPCDDPRAMVVSAV